MMLPVVSLLLLLLSAATTKAEPLRIQLEPALDFNAALGEDFPLLLRVVGDSQSSSCMERCNVEDDGCFEPVVCGGSLAVDDHTHYEGIMFSIQAAPGKEISIVSSFPRRGRIRIEFQASISKCTAVDGASYGQLSTPPEIAGSNVDLLLSNYIPSESFVQVSISGPSLDESSSTALGRIDWQFVTAGLYPWNAGEPCIQHPTYRGGDASAYTDLAQSLTNLFETPSLGTIKINVDAKIPMSNCGTPREFSPFLESHELIDESARDALKAARLAYEANTAEAPDTSSCEIFTRLEFGSTDAMPFQAAVSSISWGNYTMNVTTMGEAELSYDTTGSTWIGTPFAGALVPAPYPNETPHSSPTETPTYATSDSMPLLGNAWLPVMVVFVLFTMA